MQKLSRQILTEFLWLTISAALTTILSLFLFGRTFLTGKLDIHLHDTYFVIAPTHILFPLFFLVTFLLYFIKEFRNSFNRTPPNWILLIAGLILIIALTVLVNIFSQFFTGSWTLYPPLSALGPDKLPELTQDPVTKFITNFLTLTQIVILVMLLYATYRWGAQKHRETSHE